LGKKNFCYENSAFPMILQSIALILLITNISYNKYIAKIITFIGPLTFGVYLIHDHTIIRAKFIGNLLNNYSSNLPFNKVIKNYIIYFF